ncbi:hypothetical protein [Lutibacter sp.]|uniref:hypothetical protein n=1 Tax=Lutibacter sp. TaxID=1925666 RepID=UPI00349FD5B8
MMNRNLMEAKLMLNIGDFILKKVTESSPEWESELKGKYKKAYEEYIETILEDIEYVKSAKDMLKKEKDLETELLEAEKFYAECLFVYIQNKYYLRNKEVIIDERNI